MWKPPGTFTAVMDLVTSYLIKRTASVLVIELIIISVILSRPRALIIHTVMGGQHSTPDWLTFSTFSCCWNSSIETCNVMTRLVSFTALTQSCSVVTIMLSWGNITTKLSRVLPRLGQRGEIERLVFVVGGGGEAGVIIKLVSLGQGSYWQFTWGGEDWTDILVEIPELTSRSRDHQGTPILLVDSKV